MAIRDIIEAPDPRLRVVSTPVAKVTDATRQLMDDMLETMYAAPGIGLAAVQVGVAQRIIVMDISRDEDEPEPRYFVNPEIIWASEELATYNEGCLSVPEYYAEVDRPTECHVRYLDYDGEEQLLKADGLLATCLQHEMDHLEGVLFIDHLSSLKRDIILKKLTKARRMQETA